MAQALHLQDYVAAERERITSTLMDYLRIASISAAPEHASDVKASAEFTAKLMSDAGFENVAVLGTGGGPAVYGDWLHAGTDAPVALVYGHHDVQPVDPLDDWATPPFDPCLVDGECRGRGAIDDKGQVLYQIEAARGLLREEGRLPVNLKMLVEGEEEIGSPHLEELLGRESELLDCDLVVVSDTGMWAPEIPSVCTGMRGLLAFEVVVRTGTIDLHSGLYGGAVSNPAHIVAGLVAGLHDESGRVTVPRFYDDVRQLTETDRASLAALPFEEEAWRQEAGVRALAGEDGFSTLERIGYRPTAEVVGISAGHTAEGIKTIVPATASVKLTFRLVPDQDPATVSFAIKRWIRSRVPPGVDLDITALGAVGPALTPTGHPAMTAIARAVEKVWGRPPLLTREGGSGPEESLSRVLGAPLFFLGVGLPGDRIHAPNERIVMDQFWRGLLAAGELWHELAGVKLAS